MAVVVAQAALLDAADKVGEGGEAVWIDGTEQGLHAAALEGLGEAALRPVALRGGAWGKGNGIQWAVLLGKYYWESIEGSRGLKRRLGTQRGATSACGAEN